MKKMYSLVAASAILATGLHATDAKKIEQDGVSFKFHDQIRYEGVEQNNVKEDATAITNRFLLGTKYKTGGISAYIELINISALDDSYNDTVAGNGGDDVYSVVKDPEQTRITQAKLMYKSKAFDTVLGRDMYTLDGHRFVGHVFWRQMPQTFDLAGVTYKGVKGLKVKAAYVYGRHTVGYYDNLWGTHKLDGTYDQSTKTNSILLNANYTVNKNLKVRAYDYMLSSISDTIGAALIGSAGDFGYKLEYAEQSSPSRETFDGVTTLINDSSYSNIELSYKLSGAKLFVAQETLDGDGTDAFQTKWATLHKFNGWSDQFLGGTPANGLVDSIIGAVYKKKGFGKFLIKHHTFTADTGNQDYGSELNVLYTNKIASVKGLSYLLKYADFSAEIGSGKVDTTKLWASLAYKFTSK